MEINQLQLQEGDYVLVHWGCVMIIVYLSSYQQFSLFANVLVCLCVCLNIRLIKDKYEIRRLTLH